MSEGRQLPLFGPSLNPVSRLKEAMRQAIKESDMSREQICDRMNRVLSSEGLRRGRGDNVTVAALDAWVAESKEGHLISVALLPAFCSAAESILPLKVLAACLEAEVIDKTEANLLALAKLDIQSKKLARKKRWLQRELEESFHE